LRVGPFIEFEFDSNGSSHQYWDNIDESVIQLCHVGGLRYDAADQLVAIFPCASHRLDYFNNQFAKNAKNQLIEHILSYETQDMVDYKLKTHWNYTGAFDNTVPSWIIREWCSFWINNVLTKVYDDTEYQKLNLTARCSTQNIFENWIDTLTQIVSALNLNFTVSVDTIKQQHELFLTAQKFHNSQIKCQQYVDDMLNGINSDIIVNNIFDEAYVQYLLRQHNIEIRCNGLDIFPSTTQQLKTLTYETLHHTNT
jgi:hypothetical protein